MAGAGRRSLDHVAAQRLVTLISGRQRVEAVAAIDRFQQPVLFDAGFQLFAQTVDHGLDSMCSCIGMIGKPNRLVLVPIEVGIAEVLALQSLELFLAGAATKMELAAAMQWFISCAPAIADIPKRFYP